VGSVSSYIPTYSNTPGKHSADPREFTLGEETFVRTNLRESVRSVLCMAKKGSGSESRTFLIHSINLL